MELMWHPEARFPKIHQPSEIYLNTEGKVVAQAEKNVTNKENELQSVRPQLCHQRASESEHQGQAADAKQPLYCYVLLEISSSTDGKFSLQSYLLCMEESGSYFLQAIGNKAKLKTENDFQPTEKPRGSVILNEREHVVGFLAFNDKDEILPLFFPHNLQGDNWPFSHVEINPEPTNTANSELEGCSGGGDDGGESQNSDIKKDNLEGSGDFESRSKSSTEDKETGSRSDVEEAAQDFKLETNEQMLGNRSEPTELSYVSQTREGNGDDDTEAETRRSVNEPDPDSTASDDSKNDGTIEVEEVAIIERKDQETGGQLGNGPKAKAPSRTRSYSEQAAMTPRTQRKFFKSHSVMAPIPLQSGALVADVIMNKVYVMSALSRHLDPSCRGLKIGAFGQS
ncbi:hypothetical protein OS493_005851 [Desmophyllum pertusum]|uniref:Uncharacterized protein n=1 Tax=Desmophyllum pertusum TaxID=174260 RepID=A0A9W9YIJ4_9CNID|nr:hypothetical protein OS493_005851 [Desmophyllum pertusum]